MDCKGKQNVFDDKYKNKTIGLSIYNTLKYFNFDENKIIEVNYY